MMKIISKILDVPTGAGAKLVAEDRLYLKLSWGIGR